MKIQKISFIFISAAVLALSSCATKTSSIVTFKVLDKETNEEIKDYKVRVQGPSVDQEFKPGEKIELANAAFNPPTYTADIEAEGYAKNSGYQLQKQFCSSCAKQFGTAKVQTVYMSREGSQSSTEPDQADPQE